VCALLPSVICLLQLFISQAVLMAIEDHVDTVKQISSSASKAQSYLGKIGTEAAGGIVDSSATVGV